ncbi:MAG: HemK/PrmC family methyltransferase [Acidimicrobiales bacterium]
MTREAYALASRRQAGEPLQYVLGEWPFRGLHLRVDRRVLIPRPETEQVVEVALNELRKHWSSGREDLGGQAGDAPRKGPICVDLGTGSGAIALSLATEAGDLSDGIEVWATDSSPDALAVAESNRHFVVGDRAEERVRLEEGSWYGALPGVLAGQIDLIVSNPPYVPEEHFECLDTVVRDWEPSQALVAPRGSGGAAGFGHLEQVIAGAHGWLGPAGVLVVELDPSQADAALATARSAGLDRGRIACDLSGRSRMLVAVQAL